ncbi:MAG: flavin dependent oxidoreductase [Rhodospirillales bacterium]|nr:flavin dependent oxidoreductase [Rhodospirillales bacterium]
MIPFSVLDLAPVPEGKTVRDALRNTIDLAQHAEGWGFHRYWLAEHHNMPGIASAATAVAIGAVACATRTMRVGAGGIMLPNHAPLIIAEQFGTLEALYPGRIDLGLGRAPGTDQRTAQALRRDLATSSERFPQDVLELQALLGPVQEGQVIRAFPGADSNVPLWLLGSSLFSAQLAAVLGLPFAFASHFAPEAMEQAVEIYRARFQPSDQLDRPYVMLALNVIAADSDDEGRRLFTSQQQAFLNLRRGVPGKLPPPIARIEDVASPAEMQMIGSALACSVVGSPATIRAGIADFIARHRPDELLVTGMIHEHAARLHSFDLAAQARGWLADDRPEAAAG